MGTTTRGGGAWSAWEVASPRAATSLGGTEQAATAVVHGVEIEQHGAWWGTGRGRGGVGQGRF